MKFKYTVIETKGGWLGLMRSPRGIVKTTLPQSSQKMAVDLLTGELAQAELSPAHFMSLSDELQSYFNGKRTQFSCKLDLTGATPFFKRVLEITRSIPYGEVRSYSWIAGQAGKPLAARAVGQAMARNPVPIIVPCHRVVASDGSLGGFGGGLEMKTWLLELERRGK